MRAAAALSCWWVFSLCQACGDQAAEMKALYEAHQWFRLRESVLASADPPLFYRAAVAVAFGDDAGAEKMLQAVIQSAPDSWEAVEAKRLRGPLRLRSERALHRLAARPQPSRIHYTIKRERLYIPLTINGRQAEYLLDTGASLSVVSESEAKRLRLKLVKAEGAAIDAIGRKIAFRRVGLAGRMRIGAIELRNVLFFVFSDDTFVPKGCPPGEGGVIGLPVIRALRTVRWDANGNFDIGFPSAEDGAAPNLAFEAEYLVVEVGFQAHRLILNLDTGGGSGLYLGFRNEFPELVNASATKQRLTSGGVSGIIEHDGLVLPQAKLYAGGLGTLLQPAAITLTEDIGSGLHGGFGLDLLNQARVVTMDFEAMRLTLQGHRADALHSCRNAAIGSTRAARRAGE